MRQRLCERADLSKLSTARAGHLGRAKPVIALVHPQMCSTSLALEENTRTKDFADFTWRPYDKTADAMQRGFVTLAFTNAMSKNVGATKDAACAFKRSFRASLGCQGRGLNKWPD